MYSIRIIFFFYFHINLEGEKEQEQNTKHQRYKKAKNTILVLHIARYRIKHLF